MKKLFAKKFIRYIIFGTLGGIFEILLFDVLYMFNHSNIWVVISNVISFSSSVILLYFVNNKYVYRTTNRDKKSKRKTLILFIITRIFGLFIDMSVLFLCLKYFTWSNILPSELFGLDFIGLSSKFIATISTTVANYFIGIYIFDKH